VDNPTLPAKLQSLPGRVRPNATLFLCRWMIEQAFRSACVVDHDGMPSEIATEAVEWIEARLDWTRTATALIPPEDLRQEFVLSFEWCCRWLDLNPDVVRQQGLPPSCATLHTTGKRLRIRARYDHGGRTSRHHVYGMPDVRRIWKAAAKQHAHEQRSQASTAVHEREAVCV
jgi:hypothetical protein